MVGRGFAGPGLPAIPDDAKFGKIYIRIDGEDDELERLEETLKASKAKVVGDIQTKPWGLRDLTVEDPDGVSERNERKEKRRRGLTRKQNIIVYNQMVKGYQMPANTVFAHSSKGQA